MADDELVELILNPPCHGQQTTDLWHTDQSHSKCIADALLANPDVVLRALDPAAIRDWVLDNIEELQRTLIQRQIDARNADPFTKMTEA